MAGVPDRRDAPAGEHGAVDLALLALSGRPVAEVAARAQELRAAATARGDDALIGRIERILSAARHREDLAEAQRIGRMGSYEWDLATGESRWSDELYRIYGCEPHSFEPTYEKLLSFVHPDDRENVRAVHRDAVDRTEAYHAVERIIRPDGDVRLVDTFGEVVVDDAGNAIAMRGICRDVTEQVRAEVSAKASRERLAVIVDSTPDALLVVDREGVIRDANTKVESVLGYDRHEVIGEPIEILLPARFRDVHQSHRTRFFGSPHPRSMGVGLDLFARRKDGTEIPVDVALGTIRGDEQLAVAFVRDISERRRLEELAARLREAEVARRQALEINDNVVQGIVTALLRLELDGQGESEVADGLRHTLAAARGIISDLLGEIEPGGLVRTTAAEAGAPRPDDSY